MSFKRNDIVSKQRLRDALEEETAMGFAHNDIVTTYAMDKAIAEGGGGGLTPYTVTLAYAEDVSDKYFYGGLEYVSGFGNAEESVIKLSNKLYPRPSHGIEVGTYEILPLYEGGGGYFSCGSATGATITGDAAIIYDEDTESYYVKVTGDCSITFTI